MLINNHTGRNRIFFKKKMLLFFYKALHLRLLQRRTVNLQTENCHCDVSCEFGTFSAAKHLVNILM